MDNRILLLAVQTISALTTLLESLQRIVAEDPAAWDKVKDDFNDAHARLQKVIEERK